MRCVTSPRVSRLLDRAEANAQGLEDWQLANLREMRRERDHAIATPQNLVSRLAKATVARRGQMDRGASRRATSRCSRRTSRKSSTCCATRPALLGKALNLDPYDALVDEFSPGMTQRRDRLDLHHARPAPARPDPRSHRAAGASARRWRSPAASRLASSAQLAVEVMKAHRLSVRSRPAGRERASVHRRRARRHPHHDALQSDRSAHRA